MSFSITFLYHLNQCIYPAHCGICDAKVGEGGILGI